MCCPSWSRPSDSLCCAITELEACPEEDRQSNQIETFSEESEIQVTTAADHQNYNVCNEDWLGFLVPARGTSKDDTIITTILVLFTAPRLL